VSAPSSDSGAPPPDTPPPPAFSCDATGLTEAGSPTGYVSDPSGAEGMVHPTYGAGLVTLSEREAFRASLPPGTDMAAVNDAIARGCSADWLRDNLDSVS
jgi:hypothetical protein